jgi:4-hydroxythreonine-4-phosphate dehydrogenase
MRVAISVGDVTGVGPEVVLKAIRAEWDKDDAHYLLIGDGVWLQRVNHQLGLGLPLEVRPTPESASRLMVWSPLAERLDCPLESGTPMAAQAALSFLREGAHLCLEGKARALVTAPVSKQAIARLGQPFVGQTEYLTNLSGASRTAMMLLGQDERGRWLRVALTTTHLPLREVADHLNPIRVEQTIELAVKACCDLGLSQTRIAVCGLNPHAGEGGQFGSEEMEIIAPALATTRLRHPHIFGPLPADTVFYQAMRGDYDVVVAMYHDQGLAPLKAVAFDTGVNWTLGLPFIRTSPDHGTAYDIAGKGVANASSMIAAISLAKQLIKAQQIDPGSPLQARA